MRRLPIALLPSLIVAALAGPARAQPPPALEHFRVERCERGQPLKLSARIRAASPATVFEPTVFLRAAGADKYLQLPMFPAGGDLYEAVVPGALTRAAFDYYLEAFDSDGNGPARAGLPSEPLRVEPFDPPEPLPPAVKAAAEPPPPAARSSAMRPAGIALVAAGAAALAAGGACAYLATVSFSDEQRAAEANDPVAWDRAHSDLQARRTSTWVLLPAGAAVALTGALLWALSPSSSAPVAVAPSIGPGSVGLGVAGQF